MKVLSDELYEEYNFGYIDILTDECLKETFDVKIVPVIMLIKDGRVYETNVLQMTYWQIRTFMDGNYLNKTRVYQEFDVPTYVYDQNTIYLKYTYNEAQKIYANYYTDFN